ncbi:MAG: M23 family metallopeptidase [Parcubacteria group bacterium]|nr:M23 family metallopeptidase [Parcubacteria group bacterium]
MYTQPSQSTVRTINAPGNALPEPTIESGYPQPQVIGKPTPKAKREPVVQMLATLSSFCAEHLARHGIIYGLAGFMVTVNLYSGSNQLEFRNPIFTGQDAQEILVGDDTPLTVTSLDTNLSDDPLPHHAESFLYAAATGSGLSDGTGGPVVRAFTTIQGNSLLAQSSPETLTKPKPTENITYYTVASGDTISLVAERTELSVNTILWANSLTEKSVLQPGQRLTLLPTDGVLYKVNQGDTLATIARRYGVEIAAIQEYNRIAEGDILQLSELLILPGAKPPATPRPATRLAGSSGSGSLASVYSDVAPPPLGISDAQFIWPAVGRITQPFRGSRHTGIDIANPSKPPVYASASGVVADTGWGGGYGYMVVIDHGNGLKTRYAHLNKIYVSEGEAVNQGDAVGQMGSTGRSTGTHVHFEIMVNGRYVDPIDYL